MAAKLDKPLKREVLIEGRVERRIVFAPDGTMYASNTGSATVPENKQRIYKVTPAGVSSVFVDGAPLNLPNGVAVDPQGNVVVVNIGSNDVQTFDKAGKLVGPNDIAAQTRQIFQNMERILKGGGASLRDVVKVTVFVTDIRYREPYGEVRQEFFPTNPPASTLVQIAALAIPGALIEIEAVAVID